jgi:RHS repeat-associated protein
MSYPRNDLLFTGRELDRSTGLYYYRARYYDPEIGRFLSEDPLGFEAGVNFYAYVGNNPVNANDPMGLEIQITGHPVGWVGPTHTAVLIVPEDQAHWQSAPDTPFTETLADGRVYLTYSAGRENGLLVSDMYRGTDAPWNNVPLGMIGLPAGVTENSYIQNLLDADATYQDGLDYDLFPELFSGEGYNSNSYTRGLIDSTGGVFPQGVDTYGGATPVPESSFCLCTPVDWGNGGASGGFVLYPSKPNTNSVARAYAK